MFIQHYISTFGIDVRIKGLNNYGHMVCKLRRGLDTEDINPVQRQLIEQEIIDLEQKINHTRDKLHKQLDLVKSIIQTYPSKLDSYQVQLAMTEINEQPSSEHFTASSGRRYFISDHSTSLLDPDLINDLS